MAGRLTRLAVLTGVVVALLAPAYVSAVDSGPEIAATEGAVFSGPIWSATAACTVISADGTISWGDGSSSTVAVSASGMQLTVTGSHTYPSAGSYSGTVTVSYPCNLPAGNASQQATTQFTAAVADAPLTATAVTLPRLTAGTRFAGTVAELRDANPGATPGDYRVLIGWGDHAPSFGHVLLDAGKLIVRGSHTYALAGGYHVFVRIRDHSGASASLIERADVLAAPGRGLSSRGAGAGGCAGRACR